MVKKIGKSEIRLLTEVELELMNILWEIGQGSVKDVLNNLSEDRKLAYTSTATILRILEQKDILSSKKQGRAHIFKPKLQKSTYESMSLQHLIKNVFNDDATLMVSRLIDDKKLSEEELEQVNRIINKSDEDE